MAIPRQLSDFFGADAVQTETSVTFQKASLKSKRQIPGFNAITPKANNSAESLLGTLLMVAQESQDTSSDARFFITGPEVQLTEVPSEGVNEAFEQYTFGVRILVKKPLLMPNPNDI